MKNRAAASFPIPGPQFAILFGFPIRVIREIRGSISLPRTIVVAIGVLAFLPGRSEGADRSIEKKIKVIRQRYAEVERELKQCRRVKRDLPGESAEGGELTGYFRGSSLRKLTAQFYGESGKALEEYYFREAQPFFVLRTESRYTKPLSGVVRTKTEERFYFDDGKLIKRLGVSNQSMALGPEAQERGRELLAQARKFSGLLR
jgi:hypothetical protein